MTPNEKIKSIKEKLKALQSSFTIQAGHPQAQYLKENDFERASEVFPQLFAENTERAILLWNEIPVLFSYNYGWYSNYDALMEFFGKLVFQEKGTYSFILMTNDFLVEMDTEWKEDVLLIRNDWMAKRSLHALANILNGKGMLRLNRNAFLQEWKILLLQITKAFKSTKVELTNPDEKTKFANIYKIINRIEGQGKRYTR